MDTVAETYDEKKRRWFLNIQRAWQAYLKIGAVLGTLGGLAVWIWFIALGGLWGFFFGWILAGLIGWFVLRFIWLPVLLGGLFLLLYALPSQMQVAAFKIFTLGGLLYFFTQRYSKKVLLKNKKGEQDNEA